jgi:hypothetical protein
MPTSSSSFFDTQDGDKGEAGKAEEWLESLERYCHTLLDKGEQRLTTGTKPLKIAILDTGIDSKHEHFRGKIGKSKTFRAISEFRVGSDQPAHTLPYGEDELPHGTHVAALLNRIAPTAWIYIARVGFGKDKMEPDCVAAVCICTTAPMHGC